MSSKGRQQARDKLARIRADQTRRRRRRLWLTGLGAAAVTAVAVTAIAIALIGPSSTVPAAGSPRLELAPLTTLGKLAPPPPAGPLGPEDVPIPGAAPLASTAASARG